MTLPVYFAPNLALDLRLGDFCQLAGDEGRHAANVRRTRPGELIDLVDGSGLRATVRVQAVQKGEVSGVVESIVTDAAPRVSFVLVQALAKGGRDEQAVETATEFGVQEVIPWFAQRSVVRWDGPQKVAKGIAKFEATARAAAKQARRSHFVHIGSPLDSAALGRQIEIEIAAGNWVFVCHESTGESLVDALRELAAEAVEFPARVVFIVGPEGGIADAELACFTDAGARPVLLAQNVLRSATAGPYAIAAAQTFQATVTTSQVLG